MKKLIASLLILFCQSILAKPGPNVVVTIQPIHSLATAVMKGVAQPKLLLPSNSSPHFFQLKPKDAKTIHHADLIIWVGPELENFLEKPFKALNPNAKQLILMNSESLTLLSSDHHHEAHEHHSHQPDDHSAHHHHGLNDPHIWLSPTNAKIIVKEIADSLMALDPPNKKQYQLNAARTYKKLDQLELEIKTILQDSHDHPFLVFHDGYQYFNTNFDLNQKGHITDNPHVPLSLHKIKMIKRQMVEDKIVCLFGEPDANFKILEQMASHTQANVGKLDPIGMTLEPGETAYAEMMLNLATSLRDGLTNNLQSKPQKP